VELIKAFMCICVAGIEDSAVDLQLLQVGKCSFSLASTFVNQAASLRPKPYPQQSVVLYRGGRNINAWEVRDSMVAACLEHVILFLTGDTFENEQNYLHLSH
jgi:hypothetical protein